MKKIYTLICFLFISLIVQAQDLYLVKLKSKENLAEYISQPSKMLSQKAQERRIKYGIAVDEKDVPISKARISQIKQLNLTYIGQTKWLNTVMVEILDKNVIQDLNNLSFVESVSTMVRNANAKKTQRTAKIESSKTTSYDYGSSELFIQQLNLKPLHQQNILGQNICIGVIDAGYTAADTLSVFNNLRNENRIIDTQDFVEKKQAVYYGSSHGTMVLSTMAGEKNGQYVGTAPKATYALYRSEAENFESPKELLYWIQAAERGDSVGVDIINTSLGYYDFDDARYNYIYQEMDGKTTLIAQGALVGVSRGIFFVNAAGNEGNTVWKMISSPADVSTVFSVGANDSNKIPASFSSYGPNSIGELKPNVSALGANIPLVSTNGNKTNASGTSFASPVTAGAIALILQQFPKLSHTTIKERIQKTGHLYTNPTTQLGYGVPDYYKTSQDLLFVNDLKNNLEVKIYPNPFNDVINVQSKNDIVSIELFNMVGQQLIKSTNKNYIFSKQLSVGAYLLKIIDSKGNIFTEKVIKK